MCYNYERLDQQDDSSDKPKAPDKQPLSVRQTTPPIPPKDAVKLLPKPPVTQQNIATPPPQYPRPNAEAKDSGPTPVRIVNDPLLTREVGEDELGVFEHSTLRYARWGFIVAVATLIVVVGTAIVFWDQFREMNSQTDILAISARQARRDSAEASITTQKQLDIAREQAAALENQVGTLRSNFTKEQRPIVVAAIVKPYLQAQTRITANIFWGNYGKSVALRTKGRGRIFWGTNAVNDAYEWFSGEAMEPYPKDVGGVIIPPGVPANENAPDSHRSTLLSDGIITKTDLDWIVANDFSAVIVSRQDYFDQLGNHYWTEGCWSHFASGAIPQCPKHNEVH